MECSFDQGQEGKGIIPQAAEETSRHPCFSLEAHLQFARMHLPVAPRCNISCNYCSRRYDCLNESRPGVTSEVLTPEAALLKYELVKQKIDRLSVVGIAGPGDALANWEETRRTIELIGQADSRVIFCLSTNGLLLPQYAADLISMNVRHVTVTVNCLEPETGARIYKYVDYRGKRYEGAGGASILIDNQLAGIEYLAAHGAAVKVNTVMIKDVNDRCLPEIAEKVKERGACLTNIMPLIPAGGSAFATLPPTPMKEVIRMRKICRLIMPQMTHCRQCRADAIGLLGEDRSPEFREITAVACPCSSSAHTLGRYKIAVASKNGGLVDQHFGVADEFAIYEGGGKEFQLVGRRRVLRYCEGGEECESAEEQKEQTVQTIGDCDAVLSLRIGYAAQKRLLRAGILPVEYFDSVETSLQYAAARLQEREKEESPEGGGPGA